MYTFPIITYSNGEPCTDTALHGSVSLISTEKGLVISATLPRQKNPRIPDEPPNTRVVNLWEYDVVECFLVGSEKYLEIELGAGGHFLILDFTAPRVLNNDYKDFIPEMEYTNDNSQGSWQSEITIPWSMVPQSLHAANAFVIVGEHYLSYSPLPDTKPNFHQPEKFPKIDPELAHAIKNYSCKNPPA